MCRLFCWSNSNENSLEQILGQDQELLKQLSVIHKDGWGASILEKNEIKTFKEMDSAFQSNTYKDFISRTTSSAGMIHLRWATEKYAVCLENSHPFFTKDLAFEHNGGFSEVGEIEDLIDPDIFTLRQGTVDSEIYFLYLLTLLKSRSMIDAYRELVPVMQLKTKYTSLNAMILTKVNLHVICAYNDDYRPNDVSEDYYHLSYSQEQGNFSAWSSGVRAKSGTLLPNNSILTLDLLTNTFKVENIF